ncbi:MAG: hypothetical protein HY741_30015 [Chloroflexi bacterium]|nr:hypothetical protein [Chloroflexota bacterium]
MDWNDLKDKVELDTQAQEKIAALTPGLFIGAVIIAATLMRGHKLRVRETAAALGERGKQAFETAAAHVPFLPKPKENGAEDEKVKEDDDELGSSVGK